MLFQESAGVIQDVNLGVTASITLGQLWPTLSTSFLALQQSVNPGM